jgi:hypothetical protein
MTGFGRPKQTTRVRRRPRVPWTQGLAVATLALVCGPLAGQAMAGGSACVVAKYRGQVLDYELVVGKEHVDDAQEAAKAALAERGFADYRDLDVRHPQAASLLDSAYVIVIRSDFRDGRGKPRSAIGCGFSARSYEDAELEAVRDLQVHFWGWKPDVHGYEVLRKFTY